jgi:hypothetical protein
MFFQIIHLMYIMIGICLLSASCTLTAHLLLNWDIREVKNHQTYNGWGVDTGIDYDHEFVLDQIVRPSAESQRPDVASMGSIQVKDSRTVVFSDPFKDSDLPYAGELQILSCEDNYHACRRQQTLKGEQSSARYGTAFDIHHNLMVVGSPWHEKVGSVDVYIHHKHIWEHMTNILPSADNGLGFGREVAIHPSGKLLVIGSMQPWVQLYGRLSSHQTFQAARRFHIDAYPLHIKTYDGGLYALTCKYLYHFNTKDYSKNKRWKLPTRLSTEHSYLAISGNGQWIAVGSSADKEFRGIVYLYRYASARLWQKWEGVPNAKFNDRLGPVALAWDGSFLCMAAYGKSEVHVLDQHTKSGRFNFSQVLYPPSKGEHVDFGNYLIVSDGNERLWVGTQTGALSYLRK